MLARRRFYFHILVWSLVVSVLAAGCHNGFTSAPVLRSITITPGSPNLKINRTLQLTAIGYFSDGTSRDLTATAVWSSAPTNVVAIGAGGLATPVGAANATTTLTATANDIQGNPVQGSTVLTLKPITFAIGDTSTINDPLAGQQWHLLNTGQNSCAYSNTACSSGFDLNVNPVYSTTGLSGYGTIVAVVDSGLEIRHEDLAANVIPNGSWNFITHTTDPTNGAATGDHGTSVAGIIAAVADNGVGGIGVAPEARLKGFNFVSSNQLEADYIAALGGSTAGPNSGDVAVFNQSYGASDTNPFAETTAVVNNFIYGVTSLRGGKGALYVKAAGNGFTELGTGATCGASADGLSMTCNCVAANSLHISCENANFDPDNVLPYNIVVGALNAGGVKSGYSTTGSALWVSAPGGEYGITDPPDPGLPAVGYQPAIVTTDQSGCAAGYAQTQGTNPYYPDVSNFNLGSAPNTACNYTSTFNGTSSATPMVSGVIALMLQANPNLTWRDVRYILAATASNDVTASPRTLTANTSPITLALPSGTPGCTAGTSGCYTVETGWTQNAAGFRYHNWYGFGLVDASAAVTMANGYSSGWGALTTTAWSANNTTSTIPDANANGASTTINLAGTPIFVEAIQIEVTLSHSYWGDIGIELVSPSGTRSVLKNIRDGFTYNGVSTMLLLSNAFLGESSVGTWTLRVVDGQSGSNTTGGTLLGWQIRVFGH